ncbi:MAG TPA: ABC transporter permease [Acidimicrobiia bacterium]|nr:ABC transporter permease [Acidimicrobiia bacterium]
MIRFFAERVIGLILVLFAVSAIIFSLGSLIPGDLATILVGSEGATPEQFERVREELGLNDPLVVQYARWMGGVVQGDFGVSPITGRSVNAELASQVPVSLELTFLALLVSTLIGVPLGILAAVHANKVWDFAIRAVLLVGFSVPIFVAGILLLLFGSKYLTPLYAATYTPISQDLTENLRAMFLPVLSIAIPVSAMTMQMTRTSMLETLGQPFITMARAKGARRRSVLYIHALKNAMSPVLTLLGFQFGILLGGLFVVEAIFSLPGVGRGLLVAIGQRDYPLVMAITMVIATAFVVVNVIVDLLYPVLDPRQRATR